mmetsp:Transcript_41019/g.97824  ORF Transcript_41019/g.97824 Transcript_41019/m.97824 type:complete len:140 (+) Transcript_41019:387-806(+)
MVMEVPSRALVKQLILENTVCQAQVVSRALTHRMHTLNSRLVRVTRTRPEPRRVDLGGHPGKTVDLRLRVTSRLDPEHHDAELQTTCPASIYVQAQATKIRSCHPRAAASHSQIYKPHPAPRRTETEIQSQQGCLVFLI